ncbi:MAG: hypothetical protein O8C67_06120 [Candidatus Methanoperedens sp.]|nr:hypothetical protein [Candidatus Methanoperedens sp.]
MTECEEKVLNKLLAAGGWLNRCHRKTLINQSMDGGYCFDGHVALHEAMRIIDQAIEIMREEKDGRPNK